MAEFNTDGSLKVAQKKQGFTKERDYVAILDLLSELEFPVGRRLLIDILIGNRENSSVQRNSLEALHGFGSLSGYAEDEIERMVEGILVRGLVEQKQEHYGKVFKLTALGRKEREEPSHGQEQQLLFTKDEQAIMKEFDFFLHPFTEEQKKAIINQSKHVLCIAGAGSGKTLALTKRIEFLVKFRGVDAGKILAVTFTRKARDEMKHRLESAMPGTRVRVETFNSFSEQFLREHNDKVYDKQYRVISYKEKIQLVIEALESLGLGMDDALEMYFNSKQQEKEKDALVRTFVNDCYFVFDLFNNQAQEFSDFTKNTSHLSSGEKETVKMMYQVCSLVKERMIEKGLRDFSDQLMHTIHMMEKEKGLIPVYDHVLVDEYQDVNEVQVRLLELLAPQHLFCVGDPRQSIYGWRGSRIDYIMEFHNTYPSAEVVHLTRNYRSRKSIVDLINASIQSMALPQLEAHLTLSGKCVVISHQSELDELMFLLESIKSLQVEPEEVFVLARTNKQLQQLSELLRQHGVEHILKTEESVVGTKGITLATVHAVKGLEAKVVYVIGAHRNNFPCRTTDHPVHALVKAEEYDVEKEEMRLFYVALSRAKETVIVSYNGTLTKFFPVSMLAAVEKIGEVEGNQEHSVQKSLNHFAKRKNGNDVEQRLREYRTEASRLYKVPAFKIFTDKTLIELLTYLPTTRRELEMIYGLGPAKIEKFGDDIMRVLNGL